MICNKFSVLMGILALGTLSLVAPFTAYGQANADTAINHSLHGGQAPPNPAGGSAGSLVVVARDLPQDTADRLRQDLVSDGFTTAEVRREAGGNHRVVLAGLPSSREANALLAELRDAGYTPFGIDEDLGRSDIVYRVAVAEFPSRTEAEQANESLADEGFVNVDVVEDNGRFHVMLGTFNRREDAQNLLQDVSRAGFALAEVVERERVRPSTTTSNIPQNLQQATRDVLSLAEKVESGEASAEEFRQLREQTQQLPQDQREIVEQLEQSRAVSQQSQQQVFVLYRNFDRAMEAGNFAEAERALAQVRQLNPNELNLPNRERVLQAARTGQPLPQGTTAADPARVQQIINEARQLQSAGNTQQALERYREALSLDPRNIEARDQVSALSGVQDTTGSTADSSQEAGGLMDNKALLYGGAGLLVLLIIGALLMRSRKGSKPAAQSSAATPAAGSSIYDPLGTGTSTPTATDTSLLGAGESDVNAITSGAAGAEMAPPAFATFGTDDEEEEKAPPPKPAPRPAVEEDDTVSFDEEPSITPQPETQTPAPASDEITLDIEEPAPAQDTPPAATASTSALDEDLESLLKGTFPGAPDDAEATSPLQSATPGDGVEELQSTGGPEPARARVIYEQSFDDETEGASPNGWSGEYDYATLTVEKLDEAGHAQCTRFEKGQGTGSATYHLSFPKASGRITAEFDIRCDQKNKFLLGVYLEKDEDFKQSIHTIVHQLDPNSPAALRMQGVAAPYDMGTWRHVRYEIDLAAGTIDGYLDNEQVVHSVALPNAPEYINTLSIRDNLATTGTLLLDNIRISET